MVVEGLSTLEQVRDLAPFVEPRELGHLWMVGLLEGTKTKTIPGASPAEGFEKCTARIVGLSEVEPGDGGRTRGMVLQAELVCAAEEADTPQGAQPPPIDSRT